MTQQSAKIEILAPQGYRRERWRHVVGMFRRAASIKIMIKKYLEKQHHGKQSEVEDNQKRGVRIIAKSFVLHIRTRGQHRIYGVRHNQSKLN